MAFFKKPTPQPVVPEVEEKPEEPVVIIEEPKKEEPEVFKPMYQTKIGKGITFYGDFEAKDPIELNGSIHGNIDSTDSIKISETGSYFGDANMHDLHVAGTVEGNILCEDIASFTGTSKMSGKLVTARLRTDDGAGMVADLKIDPGVKAAPAAEPAPFAAFEQPAENNMFGEVPIEGTPVAEVAAALAEEGDVPVTEEDLFS